tara:strand:- start:727 stop:1173 length:447 start_codon:yes stop_codon:yes gene_type:complete
MAYAIATIVIMLCVIVALSIYIVRERKAHMTFIHSQTVGIDAPFLPRLHLEFVAGVLKLEKADLQEQVAVLQNRCSLLDCELEMRLFSLLGVENESYFDSEDYNLIIDALHGRQKRLFNEGHHDEKSWEEQMASNFKAVRREFDMMCQ